MRFISFVLLVIFFFTFFGCKDTHEVSDSNQEELKLIETYISIATNKSIDDKERIINADNAFYWLDKKENDIPKRKKLTTISKIYYELEDSLRFFRTTNYTIELANSISDSLGAAFNYNRLAIYYERKNRLDSAYSNYFKAEKIYSKLNDKDPYNHGKALLGLSVIRRQVKDYTNSISTTVNAIKKFELDGNAHNYLSICYSNMGIVSNNLEEYNKAIEYHFKSLEHAEKLKNKDLREILAYNNIGIVYKNQKKYDKAIEYYNKALSYKEYLKNNPKRYALLLDNLAYTRFLSGEDRGIYDVFINALRIRDSIDDKSGISINTLHLAEYFQAVGEDSIARLYANRAKEVSSAIKYNPNLLRSFQILSEVSDKETGLRYAQEYIKLNDSLVKKERLFRDKFARIQFETDEIAQQNVQISRENEILIIAILGLTALFLLGYIIFRQQQSNKELLFAQTQQEADAEIQGLLKNQLVKLEEGRQLEQKRMSEELHDGVLGRLFGVRLSLDGINQRANDGFTEARNKYIEELKSIEKEIRLISHDLSTETLPSEVAYIDAIEELVGDLCGLNEIKYEFNNDEHIDWEEVTDQKKVNFYRILQESLQNIFKHANAENVKISFDYVEDKINLTILDDGIGFKSNKVKRGIGLKNITSRVSQMSGVVQFLSNNNAGTKVSVSVPV